MTAVAGGLIATYYPFQPYVGLEFVIIMYAGVVLGGMGSTIGAFWGGMTIGLVQQLSTLILPNQLQNATIFSSSCWSSCCARRVCSDAAWSGSDRMTMSRATKNAVLLGAGLALYLAASLTVRDSYYQLMLTLVPVWAAMGVAWNIFSGYSGLVSFGHAAFFGLGAFAVTLLFVYFDVTPWLGMIAAGAVGALAALVIGYSDVPSPRALLRPRDARLSARIAVRVRMARLSRNHAADEARSPAAYMQFADQRYYIVLAVLLLAAALAVNLVIERTRFGLSLLAIKQNELAAQAAGINPFAWKLKAIVLSGTIAGIVGGFYAVVLLVVTPSTVFGMLASAQAMIVALFGGAAHACRPGDRRAGSDSPRRDAACRTGKPAARNPRRRVRHCDRPGGAARSRRHPPQARRLGAPAKGDASRSRHGA